MNFSASPLYERGGTHLVQVPSNGNQKAAIVAAEVETALGLFSVIGYASPANVSRAMLTCTIRLAETRAKARALRDAVNVGVAALEELGGEEEIEVQPTPIPRPPVQAPTPRPAPTVQPPTGIAPPVQQPQHNAVNLATPAQVRAIYSIARDEHNVTEVDVDER